MQIWLNNEELDVLFETEKLLIEVLQGIANWLESDGYCLQKFILDGVTHTIEEQPAGEWNFDLFQQEVIKSKKLEIFSQPMQAQQLKLNKARKNPIVSESENTILESLKTLQDYFNIAYNAFKDKQFIFLSDFFKEPEPLFELLQRSLTQLQIQTKYSINSPLVEEKSWHKNNKASAKLSHGPQSQTENATNSNIADSWINEPKTNWESWNDFQISQPSTELIADSWINELRANLELWNYFQIKQPNTKPNPDNPELNENHMSFLLQSASIKLKDLYEEYKAWLLSSIQKSKAEYWAPTQLELAQPAILCDTGISELQNKLSQKSKELEETIMQLQNGQTQKILYQISELSLLLEQLFQQNIVQKQPKCNNLFTEIKPFLQELIIAIEEMDTVSIGDLIEYEIIPRINELVDELGQTIG